MQKTVGRLLFGGVALVAILLLFYSQFNLVNMERWVHWRFPDSPQLTTADLAYWLADDNRVAPVLIDVRRPEEFAVSHLPGAIRVDEDSDVTALLAQFQVEQPLVLYCAVGYRSSKLAQKLIAAGRNNVWSLQGSIFAWAEEGRPLINGTGTTTQVHPANMFYGLLLSY